MSGSPLAAPQRRCATVLFADIYGYSRLMGEDEVGTYQRVTSSIELIRTLMGDYGGQVVQTTGDGVLALFDECGEALRFALAMQREFRNDVVWNADGEPISFRIGINRGDVLGDLSNVHGHSVNIAARLQQIASPGGICISAAVCAAVDSQGIDCAFRPLGRRQLRNIRQPVEVYAVEIEGSPARRRVAVNEILEPAAPEVMQDPGHASVTLLPLDNLSGDPRDEHLCTGITGDIVANLSRFRDLSVIAHHSSIQIKHQGLTPEQVNERCGVRYMVNGGLQRAGTRIRLRVELIETATQHVLWSDRFAGALDDIFGFQDMVTDSVASRLAIQIYEAERRRMSILPPTDLRAYGLILRGQELGRAIGREHNLHARRLFEHALALAPGYGRSYTSISRTYHQAWRYGWDDDGNDALERARAMALQAINHDSHDARGFAELGFTQLYIKEHDASLAAYERALELNPNDADILAEMADALSCCGDAKRAVEQLRRAMRLNPFFPDWYSWFLGDAYFHLEDYEQAIETLKRMRDPTEGHRLLASSYAHLGLLDEARHHARRVKELHPGFSLSDWKRVPPDKSQATLQRFIEGLRLAGLR
jgi:TolB-like protein/class 3 adenylate cyclase